MAAGQQSRGGPNRNAVGGSRDVDVKRRELLAFDDRQQIAMRAQALEVRPIVGRVQLAAESDAPSLRIRQRRNAIRNSRDDAERRCARDLGNREVFRAPRFNARSRERQWRGARLLPVQLAEIGETTAEPQCLRSSLRWRPSSRQISCCGESERRGGDCRSRSRYRSWFDRRDDAAARALP